MAASRGGRVTRQCEACGGLFECYRSEPKKFCGRACWATRVQPVTLTCGECAQPFQRAPGRSAGVKFCSKECLGAANGKRLAGPRGRIAKPCEVCGAQMSMIPAVVGRKRFCGHRCKGIALVSNPSRRPRTSQIGDAAILAWAEAGAGDLDWQPELRVSRWTIDLAFPALMLAVELDGVFWHSRPGMKEKDQIRDATLRGLGWTVRRIPIEQGVTPVELAVAIAEVVGEHASRKAVA